MDNLISVIVPTYKRPQMLKRALISLTQQTYKNLEVIVVDDNGEGSVYDEDVFNIVKKYEKLFNKFTYIKNKHNLGGGLSRNEGIKVVTGDFVTFLDDDDEYYPNKVEKQLACFNNSKLKNLGYVYCQMDCFDAKHKKFKQTKNFYRGNRLPYLQHLRGCISGTPTLFIKTEVLKSVGGFKDIQSGQDWTLVAEILRQGYSVDFTKEPLIAVYHHNEGRISTSIGKYESLQNELLELKKQYVMDESQEIQNDVLAHHYYQMASVFKYENKRKAWSYFVLSKKYDLPFKQQVKFIVSCVLGKRMSEWLR